LSILYILSFPTRRSSDLVLGRGTLFGLELWGKDEPNKFTISFFSQSAGAFLTYGLFIAVFTLCYNAVERKARHIAAKHAATTEVDRKSTRLNSSHVSISS